MPHYAKIRLDSIPNDKPRSGWARCRGYFDYDAGIQVNVGQGSYALGQGGITLTKDTDTGYGTLTYTTGSSHSFVRVNPPLSLSAKLVSTVDFETKTDGEFLKDGINCELKMVEEG